MATGRIGVTPTLGVRWSKAPASGTTSLSGLDDNSVSLVYSVGYEQVYRNGVLLSRGNDYTATNGTTVTLTDATVNGDIIEIFANELVPLADAISKGQFTAKGSLLSASAASTPAVLAVGSNDQVLTADSSTTTGLKWATPSSGGMTSIASGSLSGSSVVLGSIPATYNSLLLELKDWYNAGNGNSVYVRITGVTTSYFGVNSYNENGSAAVETNGTDSFTTRTTYASENVDNNHYLVSYFPNYADSASRKLCISNAAYETNGNVQRVTASTSYHNTATAISSLTLSVEGGGNFSGGTYTLWGVK